MQHKAESDPDLVDQLLVDYDQALAAGSISSEVAFGPAELSPGDLDQFQKAQSCLMRLERFWPRHTQANESIEIHEQAVALAQRLQAASIDSIELDPPDTAHALAERLASGDDTHAEEIKRLLSDRVDAGKYTSVERLIYDLLRSGVVTAGQLQPIMGGDLGNLTLGDFLILEELGRGGMGTVYRAVNQRTGQHVALKTLHRSGSKATARIKKEFRTLASVAHPNLVVLDHLYQVDRRWFFTMELIDGVSLVDYIRHGAADGDRSNDIVDVPIDSPEQFERLRTSLAQLALGLKVLHQAGILHRDLKPGNVLVDRSDRVILLDFGLVLHARDNDEKGKQKATIAGTRAYMAPEQAAGKTVTAASDWYSVGIILHEVLTGVLPTRSETAANSASVQLPPAIVERCPTDVVEICNGLLSFDPDQRPSGEKILQLWGNQSDQPPTATPVLPPADAAGLFGRDEELGVLSRAFAEVQKTRGALTQIVGPPGIGKSALVDHHLQALEKNRDALVLRGRCYEREAISHKAFDGIMESLREHLLEPSFDSQDLRFDAIVRLFPVFRRFARDDVGSSVAAIHDEREVLQCAVAELRAVFEKLCDNRPVVLFVDDLQWGDADSAALLLELIRPPNAPPLQLIITYRSGYQQSLCLRRFHEGYLSDSFELSSNEIELGPMPRSAVEQMARHLDCEDETILSAISSEKERNPFVIRQLIQLREFWKATDASRMPTLGQYATTLEQLTESLEQNPRELLQLVCVIGHPLRVDDIQRIVGENAIAQSSLAPLLSLGLVRNTNAGGSLAIEPSHDRIREIVSAIVPEDRKRAHHLRMADVLEESATPEPSRLYQHFLAGGNVEKACRYGIQAAEAAAASLAFDHAASLYENVLAIGDGLLTDECGLRKQLAIALANAGNTLQSAKEFQCAAALSDGYDALELLRLSAVQHLKAGYIDEGINTLEPALKAVGMKISKTNRAALLMAVKYQLLTRLRGLGYHRRDNYELPPLDRLRLDVCWTVGALVGMTHATRGMAFICRYPLFALRSGSLAEIARVHASQGNVTVLSGGRWTKRTAWLFQTAKDLAEESGDPGTISDALNLEGAARSFTGDWAISRELLERAERHTRERFNGSFWEMGVIYISYISSFFFQGDLRRLQQKVEPFVRNALARGDKFSALAARTFFGNMIWLAKDDVATARRHAQEAAADWPQKQFFLQNVYMTVGSVSIELFDSKPEAAEQQIRAAWPGFSTSLHAYQPIMQFLMRHIRARTRLAMLAGGDRTKQKIHSVRQDIRWMRRRPLAWMNALATLASAGLSCSLDHRDESATELRLAIQQFESCDMALFAAAARYRLPEVEDSESAPTERTAGETVFREQGVVAIDRMVNLLAPGFIC